MCSFCTSLVFKSRNPGTAYRSNNATEDIVVLNIIKSPQVLYHEFRRQTTGKFIINEHAIKIRVGTIEQIQNGGKGL